MGMGFGELTKQLAEGDKRRQAAQASREASNHLRFSAKPGSPQVVRFLEEGEDVVWAYAGKVDRFTKAGRPYSQYIVTRDQKNEGDTPCPIRERGLSVSARVWLNVIWRNAPIYGKNDRGWTDYNNIVGHEDQLAIWEFGQQVAQTLYGIDNNYKGLMSRDFLVTPQDVGGFRQYSILPVDPDGGPQPMSDADKALASGKPDLRQLKATPKSYEDIILALDGGAPQSSSQSSPSTPGEVNPFAKRN